MTEVRFLPPAAKFIKKLREKKLEMLYQEAVDKIREDHTVGEIKTSDHCDYGRNQGEFL